MVITFGNLKGGVGKSKLNAYYANYLANEGVKTLLIDCDVSQFTTKAYKKDPQSTNPEVVVLSPERAKTLVDFVRQAAEAYDVVLLDLPGTFQQEGLFELYACVDYAIVPTTLEEESLHSTEIFIEKLKKLEIKHKVLINNYEVQYFGVQRHEDEGFKEQDERFGGNVVFPIGIRKERSLFQANFVLGNYISHRNTERVERALKEVTTEILG